MILIAILVLLESSNSETFCDGVMQACDVLVPAHVLRQAHDILAIWDKTAVTFVSRLVFAGMCHISIIKYLLVPAFDWLPRPAVRDEALLSSNHSYHDRL